MAAGATASQSGPKAHTQSRGDHGPERMVLRGLDLLRHKNHTQAARDKEAKNKQHPPLLVASAGFEKVP